MKTGTFCDAARPVQTVNLLLISETQAKLAPYPLARLYGASGIHLARAPSGAIAWREADLAPAILTSGVIDSLLREHLRLRLKRSHLPGAGLPEKGQLSASFPLARNNPSPGWPGGKIYPVGLLSTAERAHNCRVRNRRWRRLMPIKNLLGLTRLAKPLTSEEGRRILERDQYRCQYCGLDAMSSFENSLIMTVDFLQPRAQKGKKTPDNLVTACRPCNVIKGHRVFPV